MMDSMLRELTAPASEVYKTIEFNTDKLYNQPAPEPWVSFLIGGILGLVSVVLWWWRYGKLYKNVKESRLTKKAKIRMGLAAWIDNDSAKFTIVKMGFYAFIFLGGFQHDYHQAFAAMLGWFFFEAAADIGRVLLAFSEVDDLCDLVAVSKSVQRDIRKNHTADTVELEPTNVYEDISRDKYIVFMVFITQAVLISFVVVDIFNAETHTCRDGTKDCPIVGTFGSWCFYILGFFMSIVFLLGPKTNFGESEQNPSFWLQLLLCANNKNQTVATCTWYDEAKDEKGSRRLLHSDWRIWVRFLMSFLINGFGFHILVHALPVQVAGQSSLTGVVFRAVGMMYLVDLDDSPGLPLTVTEGDDQTTEDEASSDENDTNKETQVETDFQAEMQKIVEHAKADMDALALSHGLSPQKQHSYSSTRTINV